MAGFSARLENAESGGYLASMPCTHLFVKRGRLFLNLNQRRLQFGLHRRGLFYQLFELALLLRILGREP